MTFATARQVDAERYILMAREMRSKCIAQILSGGAQKLRAMFSPRIAAQTSAS
ncbi:RSP_7527 family protein [Aestuariivita sp.]|uniref:RSP_7527 family protein n=1 Tax=Aestuariivita sp. TaxID=1872407 RepID=UPI0034164EA1